MYVCTRTCTCTRISLSLCQVTLVHVNAVAKNAADDKLRQSLRRFAGTYPAPSTVVLVSSDVNFSSELSDLRHVLNITIVLVHSRFTSDALKVFAHELVSYEKFLEDVEGPKGAQVQMYMNTCCTCTCTCAVHCTCTCTCTCTCVFHSYTCTCMYINLLTCTCTLYMYMYLQCTHMYIYMLHVKCLVGVAYIVTKVLIGLIIAWFGMGLAVR